MENENNKTPQVNIEDQNTMQCEDEYMEGIEGMIEYQCLIWKLIQSKLHKKPH